MLRLTEAFLRYRYIGIDPGLSQCGIAIFHVHDGQLASIDALTIVTNRVAMRSEYQPEYHTDRDIRSDKLCMAYRSILDNTAPSLICCESPFFNRSMPGAYGSLTDTLTRLKMTTYHYSSVLPFVTYAPQEVKQAFKRAGRLGKATMREALSQDPFLMSKLNCPLDSLDEHGIDAIGVGYARLLSESL